MTHVSFDHAGQLAQETLMIIVSEDQSHAFDMTFEINRLRGLANDLEQILNGKKPDETELSNAPLIEGWTFVLRPVGCLTGKVTGHPGITQGDQGVTTEVFAFAPTDGYVRTLSRYYRLGSPEGVPPDNAP